MDRRKGCIETASTARSYPFPTCLVVGLGKTHGPALAKDACPYSGAATNYVPLSDRTIE
jgi:hypothetical protein